MVKGESITVVWNIDDIKVSHKYPFEVNNFSQYLPTVYGNKVKEHRGEINYYLGIYLYY